VERRVRCEAVNFSSHVLYHGFMSDTPLFPDSSDMGTPTERPQPERDPVPPPRLRMADRELVRLVPISLDELIPPDHDVRFLWNLVSGWDLSQFLDTIRARGATPGRPATDPRILITLWLYASTRGISTGRELARLCEESVPYRWICGGVSLNYHTLDDFRVDHGDAVNDLLTQMLAVLIRGKAVTVQRIAQDGTRVRVGAGSKSFKRKETLEQALQQARAHLEILQRQAQRGAAATARQKAAQERAARERLARVETALEELAVVECAKAQQKDKATKTNPPRASTTDPETRFMRMPDGGNRPAFNVQLAVDTESRAIVAVAVTNAGSDAGLSTPLRAQVEERTGEVVKEHLLDGGYVRLEDVDTSTAAGTTLFMPVPKPRKPGTDPHQPKTTDSNAVADWRTRMGTPQAKAIYKERAATIETVHGELKTQRGLDRFRVRGLAKALSVVLWSVLAYNVVHLRAALSPLLN
jgi:transposase